MGVRIGDRGVSVGRLVPAGEVDVGGIRHPARAEFGKIDPNSPVVVVGSNEFGLLVRPQLDGSAEEAIADSGHVLTTPVEKVEERCEAAEAAREEALRELRAYFVVLILLPLLCGALLAGIGYWASGETAAVVGMIVGTVLGTAYLVKLILGASES
jgi:hypothetical protein